MYGSSQPAVPSAHMVRSIYAPSKPSGAPDPLHWFGIPAGISSEDARDLGIKSRRKLYLICVYPLFFGVRLLDGAGPDDDAGDAA